MADPEIDPMKQEDEGAAAAAPQSSAELKELLLSYGRPFSWRHPGRPGHAGLPFPRAPATGAESRAHAGQRPPGTTWRRCFSSMRAHPVRRSPSLPWRVWISTRAIRGGRKAICRFRDGTSDHEFREVAEINRAQCIEALGRTEDALKAYDTILPEKGIPVRLDRPDRPRRCLEQSGQYDEARRSSRNTWRPSEGPWPVPRGGHRQSKQKRREAKRGPNRVARPAPAPVPAPPRGAAATNTVPPTPAP
jgi:hypothetical protein